jgi:beta-lactam-binding protein with PASTA domain
VIIQSPATPMLRTRNATPTIMPAGGPVLTPDVRGRAARDAMRAFTQVGLRVEVQGSGLVVRQSPEPGAPVQPGSRGRVELSRQPEVIQESVGGQW